MIKIVKQYSVFLPNIPGALSKFVELFSKEGVNIIGIASEIRDDSGIVRITVDTDRKISYLLTNAGFTTVETQMIMIELPDKPGTLFKLTSMLADNGINITTVYGTTYTGSIGHLLLNVSDATKAMELIKGLIEAK